MNWKYHTVYSEVGFTEKFRIRTDGTRWQVRKEDGFETYISLARHVAAMQLVLQRHPEAEMEIPHWFKPEEITNYRLIQEQILYDVNLDGILE